MKLTSQDESDIRDILDDYIVLWMDGQPSDDASSSTTVGRPICSLVVVRTEDGWKITAARLMEPMTPETLATRQAG
jgi:hypothetical protein